MEMQQIKHFLILSKEMSFTDAAEALYISQSALSKQIKLLEHELGVTLFNRSTRQISLTRAGQDFEIHATRMANIYDSMLVDMTRHANLVRHTLTIDAAQQLTYYGLTDVILNFCKINPSLNVVVNEVEQQVVAKKIRRGLSEMGILYYEYIQDFDAEYIPIYIDRLVLVAHRNHTLAKNNIVEVEQLKNETLMFIRAMDLDCREIVALCEESGFTPKVSPSDLRLNSMERYITGGTAVAIMPYAHSRSFTNPALRTVELSRQVPRTLCIAIEKERSTPTADVFINYIIQNYKMNT